MATRDKDTQTNTIIVNKDGYMMIEENEDIDLKIEFIDPSIKRNEDWNDNSDIKTITVSDIIDLAGYGKFQILLSLAAGCVVFTDAMEATILSLLSPVLECTSWYETLPEKSDWILSSSVFLAMIITAPLWGFFSDRFGRRKSLIASSLIFMWLLLVTTFSPNFNALIVLSCLCGCCISCMAQAFVIVLEFLPSYARGRGYLIMALVWACGGGVASLVAWGCMTSYAFGWRILIICCIIPLFIFICLCYWVPESVLYLVAQNQIKEAAEVISILINENEAEHKFSSGVRISKDKSIEASNKQSNLPSTIALWIICIFAGFNYYGVILFTTGLLQTDDDDYAVMNSTHQILSNVNLFDNAEDEETCHILSLNDYMSYFYISLAEIPVVIISLWAMDIIGRRYTFIINSSIYVVSLAVLSIGLYYQVLRDSMVTFILFLARGSGVAYVWCCYIYTPEIYPTESRAVALGIASSCIRTGAVVTPLIAQGLIDMSESIAIGIYAITGFIATVLPFILPIETNGANLSRESTSR